MIYIKEIRPQEILNTMRGMAHSTDPLTKEIYQATKEKLAVLLGLNMVDYPDKKKEKKGGHSNV